MPIYRTAKTCSKEILFEVKDNILTSCIFVNGCSGNNQGISKLVVGQNIDDIIEKLSGIICKTSTGTSCPDQLAKALQDYKQKQDTEKK